jgi:hypothetical protein
MMTASMADRHQRDDGDVSVGLDRHPQWRGVGT